MDPKDAVESVANNVEETTEGRQKVCEEDHHDVRKKVFQENVNKRVLLEWVRITGLENKNKWKYDRLLAHLANVITGYTCENKSAFTWPTSAGTYKGIAAIRAKVSYEFWKYFMSEGRKKLAEYNKNHGTKISILKELTLKSMDENNLGLLIRKKLNGMYAREGLKGPEMFVRRGCIHIGKDLVLKPSVAAIRLNLALPEWKGLPVEELLNERDKHELKIGNIKYGDLVLPGLKNFLPSASS
ncbi:hypothetical protein GCK32_010004 [Trichostrongylus colubriformis]|uniref:Uncharacterized protein n=1 Tax=Trichostrongylus colubriformis TaxID=6319 RepID=A0AAN8FWU4_TRICO